MNALNPCLITGAAGFIGSRLAFALRSDGIEVRGLVRPEHDAESLEAEGVRIVRADATDTDAVVEAARGCRAIFHLAAARGPQKLKYAEYRDLNLKMSKAAAQAALLAGVGTRLIAASTTTATGYHGPELQTEATPPRPNSAYRSSRILAERFLQRAGRAEGSDVVIARISQMVLGPGAREWARLFRAVRDGRIRVLPRGGTIHSGDVADIVDGLRHCAVTPGICGERFLLAAERPTPMIAVLQAIADELGVAFQPRVLPPGPFRAYVTLGDLTFRVAKIELPYHYTCDLFASRFGLDIGHAGRRLGFSPRFSTRQSITRTAGWLLDHGLV